MNPDIKSDWVGALRSGEYKQGTDWLCAPVDGTPRYCCLGVLCHLAEKAGVIPPAIVTDDGVLTWDGHATILPLVVAQWAGLTGTDSTNPVIAVGENKYALSEWNDGDGDANGIPMPFTQIADLIEEHL